MLTLAEVSTGLPSIRRLETILSDLGLRTAESELGTLRESERLFWNQHQPQLEILCRNPLI